MVFDHSLIRWFVMGFPAAVVPFIVPDVISLLLRLLLTTIHSCLLKRDALDVIYYYRQRCDSWDSQTRTVKRRYPPGISPSCSFVSTAVSFCIIFVGFARLLPLSTAHPVSITLV